MSDMTADVVVVGFGAAGACAAIEAADAGADVLVFDRFDGGGASAVSGGVVYAGGGTRQQLAAGVCDSVPAMLDYLRTEVGDAVSERALRTFCEGSVERLEWLESNGVPFDATLCPYKTSYPSDDYYLYYSGSEQSCAPRIPAAPRGHRAHGPGTSGKVLFGALATATRARGVRIVAQTEVLALTEDGLSARTLRDAPGWVRRAYHLLTRYSAKPGLYYPPLRRLLHARAQRLMEAYGKRIEVRARRGVVLSAGGFIANRKMLAEYAPGFRGGLPLGTSADDGAGIRLGMSRGGATANMERVSAWRFITPPSAFLRGIVVNAKGERFIDESRYGAATGEAMLTEQGGKAWLLIDEELVRAGRASLRREAQWFQRLQMHGVLRTSRIIGATIAEVAGKAGIDAAGLERAVAEYRTAARDAHGKHDEYRSELDTAPYSLINLAVSGNPLFPCPMMTLGGLVVHEDTGEVLGADGSPVRGVYAAGRTASGICSRSYVSGLSLADCVYSGRRAGRAAALNSAESEFDKNENMF